MKTNKIVWFFFITIVLFNISSCGISYRMTTEIRHDGSCVREIYVKTDSAFLVGDFSHNPLPFRLDSSWQVTPWQDPDTAHKWNAHNTKISKTFHSVDEISPGLSYEEIVGPLVAPKESIQKKFRWFYTYYIFEAVYPEISDRIPVPINKYMDKAGQKLWFQGDVSAYKGMTGFELYDELAGLEKQFNLWHARNIYDANYRTIVEFDKTVDNNPFSEMLPAVKDTLFHILSQSHKFALYEADSGMKNIYSTLDNYFQTDYFSKTYQKYRDKIETINKKETEYLNNIFGMYYYSIDYELAIPGKLLCTNAPENRQDTLVWKVDALRFTADDYVLVAESRTTNIWAFVVAVLLAVVAIICLIKIVSSYR